MKIVKSNTAGSFGRIVGAARGIGTKLSLALLAMFAGMQAAMAQSTGGGLGAAAKAQVDQVFGDVNGVLLVLVTIVFLLVAWAYLKRAK